MNAVLRAKRLEKGLTLRAVAQALDIDQALVSKFESGARRPTLAQLEILAQLYGLDNAELSRWWLTEKIKETASAHPQGLAALKAAMDELSPEDAADPLQKLLDEMDALKQKFGQLRK